MQQDRKGRLSRDQERRHEEICKKLKREQRQKPRLVKRFHRSLNTCQKANSILKEAGLSEKQKIYLETSLHSKMLFVSNFEQKQMMAVNILFIRCINLWSVKLSKDPGFNWQCTSEVV